MNRAVIFYSLDGNTKEAAQKIAEALGAACIEIETAESMPDGKASRILYGGMLSSLKKRPPIKPLADNPESFDEIILGTPVWAWKCAAPVRSFLADYAVADKVTAVFTCSGGAEDSKCIADLKTMLPNIRCTVMLADRNSNYANGNAVRLKKFIAQLRDAE